MDSKAILLTETDRDMSIVFLVCPSHLQFFSLDYVGILMTCMFLLRVFTELITCILAVKCLGKLLFFRLIVQEKIMRVHLCTGEGRGGGGAKKRGKYCGLKDTISFQKSTTSIREIQGVFLKKRSREKCPFFKKFGSDEHINRSPAMRNAL